MSVRLSFLLVSFVFVLSFVSYTQSKRVLDQMYISFDRVRYCVRRLNATHEIGCQSAVNGNSGRMYMIDSNEEFNSFLANSKLIDSFPSFIIALNVHLFDTDHVDQLMTGLHSKLNGLLLYLKSNLTRPEDFTHDDQCPNHRNSYYFSQDETINWNSKGTGLFFRSFPFPMMLIDEEDDYNQLIKFYRQFNSSSSSPACGLELQTFQSAAHTSQTCLRRNTISHLLLDSTDGYCDPINGLNIYSKLPQSLVIQPNKRPEKSVILILASTDSFQMFLKTQGLTGGAQQPATALILFLALAHLVGQEQNKFNQQDKEIIFVTLDGEALDYSGSFRFLYDMENGFFPTGDNSEERIQFEHIHSVIEFQALSFTEHLFLFSYPSNLINETFINTLVNKNPKIIPRSSNPILPPASSQIFLRQTSSRFPVYILTSANESQLSNHYYHSFFDNPLTLSINMSTLDQNTTTEFGLWIKSIVEPLAQTLLEFYTNTPENITIEQEIIDDLVYCVFKNINCPLIQNITNQSIAESFQPFDQTALPFAVSTYPIYTTPTFPFVQNILSYFLRDRTYDTYDLTETTCQEYEKNDSLRFYRYVNGYLPSISAEPIFSGYCVRSYIRFADSGSPAFAIDNYDLSQKTYPQWTESRWSNLSLRLFVIPTKKHETVTLVLGILLLSSSFIVLLLLRCFTSISLLQPSSS